MRSILWERKKSLTSKSCPPTQTSLTGTNFKWYSGFFSTFTNTHKNSFGTNQHSQSFQTNLRQQSYFSQLRDKSLESLKLGALGLFFFDGRPQKPIFSMLSTFCNSAPTTKWIFCSKGFCIWKQISVMNERWPRHVFPKNEKKVASIIMPCCITITDEKFWSWQKVQFIQVAAISDVAGAKWKAVQQWQNSLLRKFGRRNKSKNPQTLKC